MFNQKGIVVPVLLTILLTSIASFSIGYFFGKNNYSGKYPYKAKTDETVDYGKVDYVDAPDTSPSDTSSSSKPQSLKSNKNLSLIISSVVEYAIKEKNSYNPVVEVWYNDGTYARGNLVEYGYHGGTGWFSINSNGKVNIIDIGQGTTECPRLVNEYKIPKESFPDCY